MMKMYRTHVPISFDEFRYTPLLRTRDDLYVDSNVMLAAEVLSETHGHMRGALAVLATRGEDPPPEFPNWGEEAHPPVPSSPGSAAYEEGEDDHHLRRDIEYALIPEEGEDQEEWAQAEFHSTTFGCRLPSGRLLSIVVEDTAMVGGALSLLTRHTFWSQTVGGYFTWMTIYAGQTDSISVLGNVRNSLQI